MADAYTDFLNLTKPEVGASRDAWGDKWNANAGAIDSWAKATDALVKRAVLRDLKDANGNPVAQTIAGPLRVSGALNTDADIGIAKGKGLYFSESLFQEAQNADGSILATDIRAAKSNVFRIINNAYSAEIFRVDATGKMTMGGAVVWSSNNLTPGNYFDRTKTDRQELQGPFSINMANPYFDLTYGNVMRMRQLVDGNGSWILRNGDNGSNFAYITTGGGMWLSSFGDLNTRIETRAANFADDRLATARAEYGQKVAKSGDQMSGDLTIGKTYPALRLSYSGVTTSGWQLREDASMYFWNFDANAVLVSFAQTGAIYSRQFGDLNNRIESRGGAFRDDAVNQAGNYTRAYAANKGGDTYTGQHVYSSSVPTFVDHVWGGVFRWRHQLHGDGNLVWKNGDNGDVKMYLQTNGDLYLSGLGKTVYSQIEQRASDYANDRLNTATARINNKTARLAYSTDVSIADVGTSALWEGGGGNLLTGFQQNGNTGYARAFRVRQLQMSDSNGNWYATGYV